MQHQTFGVMPPALPPTVLDALCRLPRRQLEATIETLIAFVDQCDGDPDLELEHDMCLAGDDRIAAGPVMRSLYGRELGGAEIGSEDDAEDDRAIPGSQLEADWNWALCA